MKVEAIHGERFKTQEAMRRQVFEYIDGAVRRFAASRG
ncbi:hypothetical protein [Halomonas sp.]